jgi:2-haloacid dehalogenase
MSVHAQPDRAIVFDLGGVLIDWNPRHMYRKLFDDEDEMERFLSDIATLEWNGRQDAGLRWEDGVAILSAEHPEYADYITAYWKRWDEMLGGPIEGTVEILRRLKSAGCELHALTNWSTETFPIAQERYEFLEWFEHIIVSGEERLIKPDPNECIFIDDSATNVITAAELGFDAIHFTDPEQLARDLASRGY